MDTATFLKLAEPVTWHGISVQEMADMMRALPKPTCQNTRPKKPEWRFWEKVFRTIDGCWFWVAGVNTSGYGLFNRSPTHTADCVLAHRYLYEQYYGPIPDNACVLHDCDNPRCVNPSHLFLGSRTDNATDKVSKGRQRGPQGEAHPKCKLTNEQVFEIRARYRAGETNKSAISREYGVAPNVIGRIISGKGWRHLLNEEANGHTDIS